MTQPHRAKQLYRRWMEMWNGDPAGLPLPPSVPEAVRAL
jgi:hypothetical protein